MTVLWLVLIYDRFQQLFYIKSGFSFPTTFLLCFVVLTFRHVSIGMELYYGN